MSHSGDSFWRDVVAVHKYTTSHEQPEGGWTPEHLMHGAKAPTLGERGEGNDDRDYCRRVLEAASAMRGLKLDA